MLKTKNKTHKTHKTQEAIRPIRTYDFLLGDNVKVTEDKRSKARIANFPFEFPDGTRGILIVLKVKDEPWKPLKDIKSLHIHFNA